MLVIANRVAYHHVVLILWTDVGSSIRLFWVVLVLKVI